MFIQLIGTELGIRRATKDCLGRASKTILSKSTSIYVEIPDSEQGWLDKIVKDFSLTQKIVDTVEYRETKCGKLHADLAHHEVRCKVCRGIIDKVKEAASDFSSKRPSYKPKVLFKLPGLQHASLNGLISLLQSRRDESLNLAEEYDQIVKGLTKLPSIEDQIKALVKEKSEVQKALNLFLKTGKLPENIEKHSSGESNVKENT